MRHKYSESNMYPETTIVNDLSSSVIFSNEENFWDSGGTMKSSSPDKCSNMPAPSYEIWDKLDLPTPPRSPCFFEQSVMPDTMEDSADLYKLSNLGGESHEDDIFYCTSPSTASIKSSVVMNELIHDCMWSGQCTDGCKSNSFRSYCSFRTRVNSFGSISNLSELSGYTYQNRSATPVSALSGVSLSLLPGATVPSFMDDYSEDFMSGYSASSNSFSNGPAALSDHSYSSIFQHSNGNRTKLPSYDQSSSEDDDDVEESEEDDDEEDEEEEEVAPNQIYLGIPTPSDSEEEIDVVGLYDGGSAISQSRQTRTIKKNLPTKPSPNQRRTLQLAVERAARNNSTVLCGAKRGFEENSTEDCAPSPKRRDLGPKSKVVSILPGKMQITNKRPISSLKKNCRKTKESQIAMACNRSDLDDDSNGHLKNRSQHNSMERKRRDDLRLSFFTLRDQVPELASSQRASKVNILVKATDYIRKLNAHELNLERIKKQELKRQQELTKKLNMLQRKQ